MKHIIAETDKNGSVIFDKYVMQTANRVSVSREKVEVGEKERSKTLLAKCNSKEQKKKSENIKKNKQKGRMRRKNLITLKSMN